MDHQDALEFAREWEAAWNSHDLDRILEHYADDVVFESPYIRHRLGTESGSVEGKDQLRAYWAAGLKRDPRLKFIVVDVRLSVDTVVINYRNHLGNRVAEVLKFREGQIAWGCGAYADPVKA